MKYYDPKAKHNYNFNDIGNTTIFLGIYVGNDKYNNNNQPYTNSRGNRLSKSEFNKILGI